MITIRPRFALDNNTFGKTYTATTLPEIRDRVSRRAGGGGWSWYVSGPKAELVALGAVQIEGGGWILDLSEGGPEKIISVHPEEGS